MFSLIPFNRFQLLSAVSFVTVFILATFIPYCYALDSDSINAPVDDGNAPVDDDLDANCWQNTPLRHDLEEVWKHLKSAYREGKGQTALTDYQVSGNWKDLTNGGNGFGFLDGFGYPLCSQLWMEWAGYHGISRNPKSYHESESDRKKEGSGKNALEDWANNRHYSRHPDVRRIIDEAEARGVDVSSPDFKRGHDYPTSGVGACSPGKIMLSYVCQHFCLENIEFMFDLPWHSVKAVFKTEGEGGNFVDFGPVMWCQSAFNELILVEARKWRARYLAKAYLAQEEKHKLPRFPYNTEIWPNLHYHDVIATYEHIAEQVLLKTTFTQIGMLKRENDGSRPAFIADPDSVDEETRGNFTFQTPFVKPCFGGEKFFGIQCPDWRGGIRFATTPELCQRHILKTGSNTAAWFSQGGNGECWVFNCRSEEELYNSVLREPEGDFQERTFEVMSSLCGFNDHRRKPIDTSWQFVVEDSAKRWDDSINPEMSEKVDLNHDCVKNESQELKIAIKQNYPSVASSESSVEPFQEVAGKVKVACILLGVYPAEASVMRDHAHVTAPYCDEFAFMVANATVTEEAVEKETGAGVHNLANPPLSCPTDEWGDSENPPNTVQKFHFSILSAAERFFGGIGTDLMRDPSDLKGEEAEESVNSYYCFIESDAYFLPENFKRFLVLKGLVWSAADGGSAGNHGEEKVPESLWIGQTWAHNIFQDGFLVEPSQGTCLNVVGMRRVYRLLKSLLEQTLAGEERAIVGKFEERWPPTGLCDPFVPNQHVEILQVANSCFRTAGVGSLNGFNAIRDSYGRFFFTHALNKVAVMRPSRLVSFRDILEGNGTGVVREEVNRVFSEKGLSSTESADVYGINTKSGPHWPFFFGSDQVWERCQAGERYSGSVDGSGAVDGSRETGDNSVSYTDAALDAPLIPFPKEGFLSSFPIVFHPHRSLQSGRRAAREGINLSKVHFSLRVVHEIVRERRLECPEEMCGPPREDGELRIRIADSRTGGLGVSGTVSTREDSVSEMVGRIQACWKRLTAAERLDLGSIDPSNTRLVSAWIRTNCIENKEESC